MFRGESLFATADKANEEAKSRGTFSASQRRFYLPPGKASEIILLDKRIEVGAFEHDLPIAGKFYKNYVPCIAAVPGLSCPLCRAGDRRTYRMFATVLDLSQYTSSKGTKVTRSRKLLAINQGDKERWQSIMQDTVKVHGTMRGTYIFMKRPNEQRSSRTGEPFAIEGRLWQHMTEAELVASYGHKAAVEGGKTIKAANEDITPHDYDKIFPFPDDEYVAKMEEMYGSGIPQARGAEDEPGEPAHTGSSEDVDKAWEDEIEDGNPEGGGAVSIDGLGEQADGGDVDAAQTLTEACGERSLDPNAYGTWAEAETAIAALRAAAEPQGLGSEIAGCGKKADTGDNAAMTKLTELAKVADLDPDAYATWAELETALSEVEAPEPPPVAKSKSVVRKPGAVAPKPGAAPARKLAAKPGSGKPGGGLVRPNRGAFAG